MILMLLSIILNGLLGWDGRIRVIIRLPNIRQSANGKAASMENSNSHWLFSPIGSNLL